MTMKARIYYEQTPRERYDSDLNIRAESLVAEHVQVDGSAGGTGFYDGESDDPHAEELWLDALVADNEFYVTGTRAGIKAARDRLRVNLGREVGMEYITRWTQFKAAASWRWYRLRHPVRWRYKADPLPVLLEEDGNDDDTI